MTSKTHLAFVAQILYEPLDIYHQPSSLDMIAFIGFLTLEACEIHPPTLYRYRLGTSPYILLTPIVWLVHYNCLVLRSVQNYFHSQHVDTVRLRIEPMYLISIRSCQKHVITPISTDINHDTIPPVPLRLFRRTYAPPQTFQISPRAPWSV